MCAGAGKDSGEMTNENKKGYWDDVAAEQLVATHYTVNSFQTAGGGHAGHGC